MKVLLTHVTRTIRSKLWCVVVTIILAVAIETVALDGPNVCMVKQKYNITKRVKYRAPMSVRTYEWCFSMPPRCSKWNTEMRDLTRLETEERIAEVAVCCPGYKMKDVSCVPICPNGKTGPGCSEDCPDNKWGPNCVHDCKKCRNGFCSPLTGECECLDGWQGESCDTGMPITISTTTLEELLTTITNMPTSPNTTPKLITSTINKSKPLETTLPSATDVITSPPPSTRTFETTSTLPTSTTVEQINRDEVISLMISTQPSTLIKTTELLKTVEANTKLSSTSTMPDLPTITSTTIRTTSIKHDIENFTQRADIYNKTKFHLETTTAISNMNIETVKFDYENEKTLNLTSTTEIPKTTISNTIKDTTVKTETTKKESTRIYPTTVKFKPKEIWIRPAQKGESTIVETKIKPVHEHPRYRSASNKDFTPANTTPKTIIVSIIPTSVSYSTYKKIALTTASLIRQRTMSSKFYTKTENEVTKPMVITTTLTPDISTTTRKYLKATTLNNNDTLFIPTPATMNVNTNKPSTSVTARVSTTPKPATVITTSLDTNKSVSLINKTNSTTDFNATNVFTSVIISTNATTSRQSNITTKTYTLTTQATTTKLNDTFTPKIESYVPVLKPNDTTLTIEINHTNLITSKLPKSNQVTPNINDSSTVTSKDKAYTKVTGKDFKKTNVTKPLTKTTEGPTDDEEFHILTEPEHITAVMGDKEADRSSVDLISVISIAGGVMMAVITVAVIIVMIERCKKPRYEDVRKINDIRMQVMIDNNDAPPPYVRSIFHTPLPDPPTVSEKCHYQPISTLDKSLKQFMRPVVVQTISPIMLENFRDILECHYDHLPRRSHDIGTIRSCCSIAPSVNDCGELRRLRASVTECTIDALKCEAKLDEIDNDNTTSEPLYAEIPCWRPPSEHALEIMNLNGEAVTEL